MNSTECEEFIYVVRQRARQAEKGSDNAWIVELVSSSLMGDAMRWYVTLSDEVQNDWSKLRKALLANYASSEPEIAGPFTTTGPELRWVFVRTGPTTV